MSLRISLKRFIFVLLENTQVKMKKILFGLLAVIVVSLTLNSCNEDIELIGEFKETAVVYGLLDQADTVHMIKITRTFIGPGDAYQIAQNPDSSYFKTLEGTVTEYINGNPARVFTLADTTVSNKDENGVFYAPEQLLYYFKTSASQPLISTAEYRLNVVINKNTGSEFTITGQTELVNQMSASSLSSSTQPFHFYSNNGEFTPTIISITSGNAFRMNVTLEVEFAEWTGASSTPKKFKWLLGESDVDGASSKSFTANGQTFYTLIAQNCTNDAAIDRRTITSITAYITGAAEDFLTYMQISEPSTTLAQSKPTYTNLTASDGHNVIGIFSARNTITVYKPFIDPSSSNIRCLNKLSTEQLCVGSITSPYLFCSDHPADIGSGESWACN